MDTDTATLDQATEPFIGQWNQLVSTTNWEKGHIVREWRQALMDAGASASEYSDDSWGRCVGGVTGQHVGRLRRVSEKFGESHTQYQGLFWSHFQAAIDWDDSELWLEGAVQNRWSISKMRRQRWETLGGLEEDRPDDREIVTAETDEDFTPAEDQFAPAVNSSVEEVQSVPRPEGPDFGDEETPQADLTSLPGEAYQADQASEESASLPAVRPFDGLADLPSDITDAFDSFKLAIIRHKGEGWNEISQEDLLATLDALKELANAPSGEEAPF